MLKLVRSPGFLLVLILAFHVLVHVRYVGLPPVGFHTWRQADTYSVARNFAEESLNILEPRVDERGDGPGIVGMEFPIIPWLVGAAWRLWGFHPAVARVIPLLLSCLAVIGCFHFTRLLLGSSALGIVGALLLVASPLFAYYAVTLMPDAPMLGPLYAGLAACVAWSRAPRATSAIAGAGGLAAAALLKLSSVVAWPAALVLLVQGLRRAGGAARVIAVLSAAVAGAIVAAWYAYAHGLGVRYGLDVFRLKPFFPYPLTVVPAVAFKLLVQWLPELFLNYATFGLFVWGVGALMRRGEPTSDTTAPPGPLPVSRALVLSWTAGVLALVVAFLPMLDFHDYYILGPLPLLLLMAAVGFRAMRADSRPAIRNAAHVLIAVAAVIGPIRGLSRLEGKHPPSDLATLAPALDRMIPDRHALVVAASDPSPDIYLYYMRRKGWSRLSDLEIRDLEWMMLKGARFLVSDSRELEHRPEIEQRLVEIGNHGRFRVFRLKGSRW